MNIIKTKKEIKDAINNNNYIAIITSYENDEKLFKKLSDPENDIRYILNKKFNYDLGFKIFFLDNPNNAILKYDICADNIEKKVSIYLFQNKKKIFETQI